MQKADQKPAFVRKMVVEMHVYQTLQPQQRKRKKEGRKQQMWSHIAMVFSRRPRGCKTMWTHPSARKVHPPEGLPKKATGYGRKRGNCGSPGSTCQPGCRGAVGKGKAARLAGPLPPWHQQHYALHTLIF